MTEQEIEKKIYDDLADLGAEDILSLIELNRFKEAESLGKFLGIPKKIIKDCIKEYQEIIK
tara:strand:- start:1361 stop:1543 length:183 start_codon:yes stop_codon:yes gene_type:complete